MNIFIGIGKIKDVRINGKVLKFNFFILQKRTCLIPCVIFSPDKETQNYIQNLQTAQQFVWLKGIVASNEFEYKGKQIRKIDILTYASSIKPI